jgi:hypothetical protein
LEGPFKDFIILLTLSKLISLFLFSSWISDMYWCFKRTIEPSISLFFSVSLLEAYYLE